MSIKQRLFYIALGGALVLSGIALSAWTDPDSRPAPLRDAGAVLDEIKAKRLTIVDSNGDPVIVMEADDLGGAHFRQGKIEAERLHIVNGDGDPVIVLSVDETGGVIGLSRHRSDEEPSPAIIMGVDSQSNGHVSILNSNMNFAAELGVKEDGSGSLEMSDGR